MKNIVRISVLMASIVAAIDCRAQIIAPTPYNSNAKVNLVRVWEASAPITHPDTLLTRSYRDVKQTTQYFDGLGRPLQTVAKKGSLVTGDTARDMIIPFVYDEYGRESYKYLSFAANNTGGNTSMSDGIFKLNPFQQDSTFNKTQFPGETYYYQKNVFESSPLNRQLEVFSAGDAWAGTSGQSVESNRRSAKSKFWVNTVADSVRIWNVADVANSFGTYSTSNYYAAGMLFKHVTHDEHNKQAIEFKDKRGRLILRKLQLTAPSDTGTGKGHYGWLCTYYVYDNLNNPRAVIQPKGVELLAAGSWTFTSTILDELCFRYEYDKRNRIIMKKIPGAGVVHLIYDARDRMVLMQDSLMRAGHQWLHTTYDGMNRPIATGLITDNTYYNNAPYHRDHADTSISYPWPGIYSIDTLTVTHYDNYDDLPLGFASAVKTTDINSNSFNTSYNSAPDYPEQWQQSFQLSGKVAWSKSRILDSTKYLVTVNYYDQKDRLIQVQSGNISGGKDVVYTQYNFAGVAIRTINLSEKLSPNGLTTKVFTRNAYDDLWRLIKIEKNVNVSSGTYKKIAEVEYDALGRMKTKKLGTKPSSSDPIETLAYEYNIRGWMLGMNRGYVKDSTNTSNYFGFDLGYDKSSLTISGVSASYVSPQYNGNIGGLLWKSTGDDQIRKYDFSYDAIGRLTGAEFNQFTNTTFNKSAGIDFSVNNLGYDANGNILSMSNKGWKLGGSDTIDALQYTYISNSNKLLNVIDGENETDTKLGDFRSSTAYMATLGGTKTTSATDYSYNGNGNLVSDKNKDISNINYNHLNLPKNIHVNGKGTIAYVYDASGTKLKQIITDSTVSPVLKTTTTYVNGFVFESKEHPTFVIGDYIDKFLYFGQEEGRIRLNQQTFAYVYDFFLKDHLGNVRMVLTNDQQSDMYPEATLETPQLTNERIFYARIDTGRIAASSVANYPAVADSFKQRLIGTGPKIGSSITLKVMAGDKFNVKVKSFYHENSGYGSPVNPINDLVSAITNSVGAISGGHNGPTVSELETSGVLTANITGFLNSQSSYTTIRPKAFLNWVLFDEQFKYVSESSGFEQVYDAGDYNGFSGPLELTHVVSGLPITKNGYLYIYVSNESDNTPVYFDNLQVTHIRGPLLEKKHYYPFGLVQKAISTGSINFGEPGTKKGYQLYEANSDFEIHLNESFYRLHDPQLGRFWQIDPKPIIERESVYGAMANNPISNIDILGDVTYYYSPDGTLLRSQEDGNKHATITVIAEKNVDQFKAASALIDNVIKKIMPISDAATAKILQLFGVSYDTKELAAYFDKHSKDFYVGDVFIPTDGKGRLVNEHMAGLELKDGYLRVMDRIPTVPGTNNGNNPVQSGTAESGERDVHTHTSEGRSMSIAGRSGSVGVGKAAFGGVNGNDLSRGSWEHPGREKYRSGLFYVVVSPTHVYLYRKNEITIAVDRNNIPSKNPGDIK